MHVPALPRRRGLASDVDLDHGFHQPGDASMKVLREPLLMLKQNNTSMRRLATLLVVGLLLSPLFDLHSHAADQDMSPADVYQDCAICVLLASAAADNALPSQSFAVAGVVGKAPVPACTRRVGCKRPAHVSYLSRAPPVILS